MNSTYNRIVEMQCFASFSLEQIRNYVQEMLILAFGVDLGNIDKTLLKWRLNIEESDFGIPVVDEKGMILGDNIVVSYTNNVDGTVSRYQMLSPKDVLKAEQGKMEWVDMVRLADETIDHFMAHGDYEKYGSPNFVLSYLPHEVGVPNKNVVKIIMGRSGYMESYRAMTYNEIVEWNEKNGVSEVQRTQSDHYAGMKHHLSDEWAEKYSQGIKEEQETYMKLQAVKEERKEITTL